MKNQKQIKGGLKKKKKTSQKKQTHAHPLGRREILANDKGAALGVDAHTKCDVGLPDNALGQVTLARRIKADGGQNAVAHVLKGRSHRSEEHAANVVVVHLVQRDTICAKVLLDAPVDGGKDLAVPVLVAVAQQHLAIRAVGLIASVRAGAHALGIVKGILANHVVAVGQQRQHVAGTLANRRAHGARHGANQSPGQAVAILVPDNVRVEIAVTVRVGHGPAVHLHARAGAVGRSGKVGIVDAAAVQRLGQHRIVLASSSAKVLALEVARRLGKAVCIQRVMNQVVEIKQVLHRHFQVS